MCHLVAGAAAQLQGEVGEGDEGEAGLRHLTTLQQSSMVPRTYNLK